MKHLKCWGYSMTEYKKPDWAIKQIRRMRGGVEIVEDICIHGVGHPNKEWLLSLPEERRYYEGIHGCDGCCDPITEEDVRKAKEGVRE